MAMATPCAYSSKNEEEDENPPLWLFFHVDKAAGIGPHMTADGGTHIDDTAVRNVIAQSPELLRQNFTV